MEDYELWLRIAKHGVIFVLDRVAVSYRIHNNQMTHFSKPFGAHITAIHRGRMALAKQIGYNVALAWVLSLSWQAAQWLRYSRSMFRVF
jgi:hypothetical protein